MSTTVLIVVTAVVAAGIGYLTNQLPEIRQFPGRNWLVIRLFVWITLMPVVYELLTSDIVAASTKTWTKYAIAPLVLLLVLDLWKLVTVLSGKTGNAEAVEPQDLRTRLLKAVQTEVAERLEDSLNQQVTINLLMQQQLSQVNRPDKDKRISLEEITQNQVETNLILVPQRYLTQPNQTATLLDPQESIFKTFNRKDVGRKLLILGAPGAGKTTTLLKLTEALIEEAMTGGSRLIPLIFELSTWKDDKQSIQDWLIDQLKLNYNIDLETGTQWLKDAHLLPLLDGLDELGLQRQQTCVEQVNEFIRGLNYPYMVVCCRSEEYAEGQVRLSALKGAVCLEPLSNDQIQRYFCQQLKQPQIWQAIEQQPGLGKLLEPPAKGEVGILQIPLFLTILSVAYTPETPIESKADLLNAYITRRLVLETRRTEREQFRRRWAYGEIAQEPNEMQTRRYLHWLGKTLNRENLVEILIERMQPRWLETRRHRRGYRLIVGLIFGLIFGLIVGLIVGLIFGPDTNISPLESFKFSMSREARRELRNGLIFGLIGGLIFGLIGGLIFGLIGGLKADFQIRAKPNQGMWAAAINMPLIALLSYPGAVAIVYLPDWILDRDPSLVASLMLGIGNALAFGIFLGGGSELIRHLTLRTILTHTHKTPWNYARFLNYCAERRLLQRIGGRYRFIHRELLDHFAQFP